MENKFTVLIVPVNESPYMKEIPNTLEAIQEVVGGYIEHIPTRERFNIIANEEGKIMGLDPNIIIHGGMDTVNGQFFVCLDDGMGEFTSISKEQAEQFLYHYVIGKKFNPINNTRLKWEL